MTDFLTRYSCLLDVGTTDNAARAFDIYTALIAETALAFARIRAGSLVLRDAGSADQQLAITCVTRCARPSA
jgi:hypothetical protein